MQEYVENQGKVNKYISRLGMSETINPMIFLKSPKKARQLLERAFFGPIYYRYFFHVLVRMNFTP